MQYPVIKVINKGDSHFYQSAQMQCLLLVLIYIRKCINKAFSMTGKKQKKQEVLCPADFFLFVSLSRQLKIVYKQCSTLRSNALWLV